jgi:hypothetical protein
LTTSTVLQLRGHRQVFPKSWFARHRSGDKRASSIVNKTPLSYRASKSLTGSPSSYLRVLAREAGTRAEWFDDVVATHLIDPAVLQADDFDGFYADRSARLLGLVNEAMGKRTISRDQSDR